MTLNPLHPRTLGTRPAAPGMCGHGRATAAYGAEVPAARPGEDHVAAGSGTPESDGSVDTHQQAAKGSTHDPSPCPTHP